MSNRDQYPMLHQGVVVQIMKMGVFCTLETNSLELSGQGPDHRPPLQQAENLISGICP